MYKVPQEFYLRLHHIRPRFKNDVENVLLYVAQECSKIPECAMQDYGKALNASIRLYPGNESKTQKRIHRRCL
ncbi:MAG: hypothetical protein Q4B16_06200 [Bacteroidia bacterium]|nr:hypothetical protein [Bacteroidia bacterium]